MSAVASPFTGRRYGVVRVTREWGWRVPVSIISALSRFGRTAFCGGGDRRPPGATPYCSGRSAKCSCSRYHACPEDRESPHRHDHGSQHMSDDYQAEIAILGMESSPSYARLALRSEPLHEYTQFNVQKIQRKTAADSRMGRVM
jgi:hypothetical protein